MVANFGEAIKRPFTDLKILLIGIVLSIIPIVNWFTFGYFLECARTTGKKKNYGQRDCPWYYCERDDRSGRRSGDERI